MESENAGLGEHPPPAPPADFETTFDRLKDVPCRPTKLTLVGLERTDRELVRKELLRVRDARTLDEVKDAVLDAYTDLMSLGIFDVVDIVIDQGDKVCVWVWGGGEGRGECCGESVVEGMQPTSLGGLGGRG